MCLILKAHNSFVSRMQTRRCSPAGILFGLISSTENSCGTTAICTLAHVAVIICIVPNCIGDCSRILSVGWYFVNKIASRLYPETTPSQMVPPRVTWRRLNSDSMLVDKNSRGCAPVLWKTYEVTTGFGSHHWPLLAIVNCITLAPWCVITF